MGGKMPARLTWWSSALNHARQDSHWMVTTRILTEEAWRTPTILVEQCTWRSIGRERCRPGIIGTILVDIWLLSHWRLTRTWSKWRRMSVCRSKEWGFKSSYTHLLLVLATSSDTGVHNAPHVGRVVRTIFLLRFLEIGHRTQVLCFHWCNYSTRYDTCAHNRQFTMSQNCQNSVRCNSYSELLNCAQSKHATTSRNLIKYCRVVVLIRLLEAPSAVQRGPRGSVPFNRNVKWSFLVLLVVKSAIMKHFM